MLHDHEHCWLNTATLLCDTEWYQQLQAKGRTTNKGEVIGVCCGVFGILSDWQNRVLGKGCCSTRRPAGALNRSTGPARRGPDRHETAATMARMAAQGGLTMDDEGNWMKRQTDEQPVRAWCWFVCPQGNYNESVTGFCVLPLC